MTATIEKSAGAAVEAVPPPRLEAALEYLVLCHRDSTADDAPTR
jgi:hypothetical protein